LEEKKYLVTTPKMPYAATGFKWFAVLC